MKAINLSITGIVQGVGFRYTTLRLARQLEVTGFVTNRDNGSVYIEVQGTEQQLKHFTTAIQQTSSPFARIDQIAIKQQSLKSFNQFEIR
ncbi:acylphosphatase [Paucilactobacillus wasatchensis]|uniref:acylphosphatase n=1 Tax=Paucilactobacillus wasatchensis TaxID=1335616 RepID=A0A0D0Y781_9LACO|nr:acylphosphatase [Paucilactobacillus wasatchensis]KIS04098.1 Acylphosphatase [Paucilactobacillus wasatchensis]